MVEMNREYQKKCLEKMLNSVDEKKDKFFIRLATGTGKTRVAINFIYEALQKTPKAKILFIVNATALKEQAYDAMMFDKNIAVPSRPQMSLNELGYSILNTAGNGKVNVETIQALSAQKKKKKLTNRHKKKYDYIIFDECHAGLRGDDKKAFQQVMNFFEGTKIGLTATPRFETEDEVFEECVYEYSLKQAIDDKFLSPIGTLVQFPNENASNSNFKHIDTIKNNAIQIAEELTLNPKYKTIIFCKEDKKQAALLTTELKKIYKEKVELISGSNKDAKEALKDFKDEEGDIRIAVTSQMLETGVDIPEVKNIVLCRCVFSPITYTQMLGRATRLIPITTSGVTKYNQVPWKIYDFGDTSQRFKDVLDIDMPEASKPKEPSVSSKQTQIKEREIITVPEEIIYCGPAIFTEFIIKPEIEQEMIKKTKSPIEYLKALANEPITKDFTTIDKGTEFELFNSYLLKSIGFKVLQEKGKTGDKGADIIFEDRGLRTMVQAKCYNERNEVDIDIVKKFKKDMEKLEITKGYIVCVFYYTEEAIEYARKHNISLININDFERLYELEKHKWEWEIKTNWVKKPFTDLFVITNEKAELLEEKDKSYSEMSKRFEAITNSKNKLIDDLKKNVKKYKDIFEVSQRAMNELNKKDKLEDEVVSKYNDIIQKLKDELKTKEEYLNEYMIPQFSECLKENKSLIKSKKTMETEILGLKEELEKKDKKNFFEKFFAKGE